MHSGTARHGFTLIELSIVLVIIGLIVGGVLVGQDLIRAAAIRATITQLERFNTAANTFYGKYGYLPGDIKDPAASGFGFAARGTARAQGDGNGVLEGFGNANYPSGSGVGLLGGEIAMFWVDLSAAHLIEGNFSTANATTAVSTPVSPDLVLPAAKLGQSNYISVVSMGTGAGGVWTTSGANYFMLTAISPADAITQGITVQQAYAIDKKIDDGLPTTGRILSEYYNPTTYLPGFIGAAANGTPGGLPGQAIQGSTSTCYDNNNNAASIIQYSLTQSGNGINCALIIQFQ